MVKRLPLKLHHLLTQTYAFGRYLFFRMKHDRVNVNAGYLAYITLLSIVPMFTVSLSIMSSFEIFSNVGEVLQDFIIDHFVPAAGMAVRTALTEFIGNTAKMTAVGGVFLFVAALMLISNIDKNLNYIWRVKTKRRVVFSFSMYWMILTLGPLLLGASIAMTSYITSLKIIDSEALVGVYNLFLRWLPFLLSFFAFSGLYLLVPNKKVYIYHSLAGALVAALLFELSKKAFAAYITHFPSYQLIYGALAAIPILFVWIYLCWVIVLIGAEVTAALGESECWREESDVLNSSSFNEKEMKESSSDSVDSKSK